MLEIQETTKAFLIWVKPALIERKICLMIIQQILKTL